jgi:hypothetical protein
MKKVKMLLPALAIVLAVFGALTTNAEIFYIHPDDGGGTVECILDADFTCSGLEVYRDPGTWQDQVSENELVLLERDI